MEYGDPSAAKRLQKAGREKIRRDRLNDHFILLGNNLDADRPKNDKATILTDTIHLLKELTAEVEKLKAEHALLSEESHELTQVKNDLKEEKEALRSDIEKLNTQYHQRVGPTYPWVANPPPSYPYPMPYSYPTLQPYPFFGSPVPAMYPNPCSTFVPYVNGNTQPEQKSTHVEGLRSWCGKNGGNRIDKHDDSDDVGTNLELKTPGSTTEEEASSKKLVAERDGGRVDGSSSRCSSSNSVQDSSSDTVVGGGNTDDSKLLA